MKTPTIQEQKEYLEKQRKERLQHIEIVMREILKQHFTVFENLDAPHESKMKVLYHFGYSNGFGKIK